MTKKFEINYNDITHVTAHGSTAQTNLNCEIGDSASLTCKLPVAGRDMGRTRVTVKKNDNGRLEAYFGYSLGAIESSRVVHENVGEREYYSVEEITVDFMIFTILTSDKFKKIADKVTAELS